MSDTSASDCLGDRCRDTAATSRSRVGRGSSSSSSCCSRHRAASEALLAAVHLQLLHGQSGPTRATEAAAAAAGAASSSERPTNGEPSRPSDGGSSGRGAAACSDGDIRALLQPQQAKTLQPPVTGDGGGGGGCALCDVARGVLLGEAWMERLGVRQLAALAAGLRAAIALPASSSTSSTSSPLPAAPAPAAPAPVAEGGQEAGRACGERADAAMECDVGGGSGECNGNGYGSGGGASAWADATRGRPLTALLRLYGLASRHHIRSTSTSNNRTSGNGSGINVRSGNVPATATADGCYGSCHSCCLAAKVLLLAAAELCRLAPAAVRSELGVCVSSPQPPPPAPTPTPPQTPPHATASERTPAKSGRKAPDHARGDTSAANVITRGLVAEVRQLLTSCPRRLVPRLGADGRIAKYDPDGIAAADPCGGPPAPNSATRDAAPPSQKAPVLPAAPCDELAGGRLTVAAAALHALAALCRCSRAAARQAYLAGVLDELLVDEAAARRLLEVGPVAAAPAAAAAAAAAACGAQRGLAGLREGVEQLYLGLAAGCTSAAEDIVSGGDVRGLVALLCGGGSSGGTGGSSGGGSSSGTGGSSGGIALALRLRAAQRLAVLADSPSACGPDDFAHFLCRSSVRSEADQDKAGGGAPVRRPAGPLEVALGWMAGADGCGGGDGGGVGALGAGAEAVVAGARLLSACLDRARRTGWLVVPPAPPAPPGFGAAPAAAMARARAARVAAAAVRLAPGLKGSVLEVWAARVAAAAGAAAAALGEKPEATVAGPAALPPCWVDALQAAARAAERAAAATGPATGGAAHGPVVVGILLQRKSATPPQCAIAESAVTITQGHLGTAADNSSARGCEAAPAGDGGSGSLDAPGDAPRQQHIVQTLSTAPPSTHPPTNAAAVAATAPRTTAKDRKPGGQQEQQQGQRQGQPQGQQQQQQYDEDGLRVVWDSGPPPALAAARSAWAARPLRERVSWSQTSTELFVNMELPKGTRRDEVSVTIAPARLTLRLGWCGRVLDGPLHRKVAPSDCIWTLEGGTLQVLLAKAEAGHWWRALFEGGEEKGLYQVLSEAVEADEPLVAVDDMDEGGRLLLEELLERQEMIADGSFDLENSFDDFRLVVGDNTL